MSGRVPRAASVQDAGTRERLFISTGTVALRSRDVADARAAVRRVVDRYRGEVAEQQSESDERGRLEHARLVVRIPSADFAEAVAALEGAADLVSSDTRAEEVTTQVIDTRVALRVQRRSVARVETLLDRASSIRDIIAIEAQLARRQARLGSLEQRAAYLADQTAMSTVSVSIDRSRSRVTAAGDDSGFLAGLRAGWDGLTAVAVALATTAGRPAAVRGGAPAPARAGLAAACAGCGGAASSTFPPAPVRAPPPEPSRRRWHPVPVTTTSRIAVLIDADNTSASHAGALLQELARYGVPTVKRAYGDWTTQQLVRWKEQLHRHAIQPIQQFAYTTGKNSTDSALIIDAMDLLYSGTLDAFAIVSSDSDFTRLATRLRESGKTVYGIGRRRTPGLAVAAVRPVHLPRGARCTTVPRPRRPRPRPTPRPRPRRCPTCAGSSRQRSTPPRRTTAGRSLSQVGNHLGRSNAVVRPAQLRLPQARRPGPRAGLPRRRAARSGRPGAAALRAPGQEGREAGRQEAAGPRRQPRNEGPRWVGLLRHSAQVAHLRRLGGSGWPICADSAGLGGPSAPTRLRARRTARTP